MITGGIRFWPQFMDDEESVLDEHDHFTVLTAHRVGNSEFFFDVQGRAWAFTGSLTVPPRKPSDCDLPQMSRDSFGAVAERPSSGIRYLCVHWQHFDISAFILTNDAKETEVPVRGFLQTAPSRMSKWESWLPSPCEWHPMRGGLGGNKEFEGAEIEARARAQNTETSSENYFRFELRRNRSKLNQPKQIRKDRSQRLRSCDSEASFSSFARGHNSVLLSAWRILAI